MGLNLSKKVEQTLTTSPAFTTAVSTTFADLQTLTAHAFPGVLPHQLPHAAGLIHSLSLPSVPLLLRWVPEVPDQTLIDASLRRVRTGPEGWLGREEFGRFAVGVFGDAVVDGVGKAVRKGVLGLVGIGGVGVVGRVRGGVLGGVMGAYAVAVAGAVCAGLL